MRAVDLIEKKKKGITLSQSEIRHFINGYVDGSIPDYQAAAFLMACCFQKLSPQETVYLTEAMMLSGDQIPLKGIQGYTVDKHSTGGVGDKTTLVLGPLVAACGVTVAKMSGRGLGHTGGTLDKLDAIEGFRSELNEEELAGVVNQVGVAVCGQTGNIVPADKKLYSLRDVTATVEDTALIAASIMSKKLAIANRGLVLDVKTGAGAFMKTLEDSIHLGQAMVEIGQGMGRDVIAVITEMGLPLGCNVGNALEVQESIDTLDGRGPADLVKLCLELGARMVHLAGKARSFEEAQAKIMQAIENKSGLKKLEEMVLAQGGSLKSLYALPVSSHKASVLAAEEGYIASMDALEIGLAAMQLGAGRERKEDKIDLSVGLSLHKKTSDKIAKGDVLATLHYNSSSRLEEVRNRVLRAYRIQTEPVAPPKLILAEISRSGVVRY